MARRSNSARSTRIDTVRHKDKRTNIPTEDLRDFVREDEQKPKQVAYPGLLYARDPSLDPQLVWKGKDEQDREPLVVPAVPIYIQEKIHPQAIIEDVRAQARRAAPAEQPDLFGDFNGLPEEFADRVDFYHHDANWSNRMILGDSLLVMTSLAEKEGLKGKVQMIYLDPPYGIKFGSNWQVSTRKRDVKDGKVEDATRQPEQVKAFRDTWELGINSYLSYWRDRLVAARELLTESGSVFVQIGDENVHLVRCVLDEVFGAENFCALIPFKKTSSVGSGGLDCINDYLLWYARDNGTLKYRQLYCGTDDDTYAFPCVADEEGQWHRLTEEERRQYSPAMGRLFRTSNLTSQSGGESTGFSYTMRGKAFAPSKNAFWKTNQNGMRQLERAERLLPIGNTLTYKRYQGDFPVRALTNWWDDTVQSTFATENIFVVQTYTRVIERCILMTTEPGDLVLDPTCGSGTTAYVAEQRGRRWITIDTSRVALALARTRLMAARFPFYLLADSPEGAMKEAELAGRVPDNQPTAGDIRKGFVYRRVPHITLKAIANNEEIDAIHEYWQGQLDELRQEINEALGKKYEEWEMPRELDARARKEKFTPQRLAPVVLLNEWWDVRAARQTEIDDSIGRRAGMETLYDQPYEDNKRIRVTGPFTVESLSPHRTISVEEKKSREESGFEDWKIKEIGPSQFGLVVIENLKKAGVQNTIKQERLTFDRLEPFPGTWIHAAGEFTEKDGRQRRAAVCIGPEHGTVDRDLLKEAAKEAVKGVGFDLLLVCGFAFDPHVNEEAKNYGKLVVLPTRINADLQMGDEFLKKTGAGNLFTVFGEPDIEIQKVGQVGNLSEKIIVEIKGLDIYDPTTGQIKNHTTDEIACWFIDTNYNGESFFVRHAYFTGAGDPYERLRRALKAEINESAWQALYSTRSRPFDPPATGRIAVKVINHYGDEVLKVYNHPTGATRL